MKGSRLWELAFWTPSRLGMRKTRIRQWVVRSGILGGILFFLGATIHQHWHTIAQQPLAVQHWDYLVGALLVSAIAHGWLGVVWGGILRQLGQPVSLGWAMRVYLTTNLAKYLPGNVWHFYGRIRATTAQGTTSAIATLSVVLESLLMAAAALLLAVMLWPTQAAGWRPWLGLLLSLAAVHPRLLNPLINWVSRWKAATAVPMPLRGYPFWPFGGEILYLLLRAVGFLLTLMACSEVAIARLPQLISAFALSWLLGFVLPGAPGGVGIFEGTLLALLQGDFWGAIAIYRLVSTLAEVLGAGIAWLNGKQSILD